MSDPEPKIRCPSCGTEEPSTGVYCGNCGALLHSAVNVVNNPTIPSGYGAPNAPPVGVSEEIPFTGYGGPVLHTPIPPSPTPPRSGQNQPTEYSDQVIQYQYGPIPPYPPPPPSRSTPPPEYRPTIPAYPPPPPSRPTPPPEYGPTIPVLPPIGGNSRTSGKWRLWVIVGSIIVVVLGSIVAGAVGFINHSNYVTAQDATATAHAQATGAAVAEATQTVSAMQTATVTANENPYDTGSWHVEFSDALTTPRYWQELKTPNGGDCTFVNSQYYRITELKPGYNYTCEVQGTSTTYTDVTMEVNIDILQGDCGGFVLRDSGTTNIAAYFVYICQNGAYELDKSSNNGNSTAILTGSSPTLSGSLGKSQVVAVTMIGNIINLFVNKNRIFQHSDSTYTQGWIGLVAVDNYAPMTQVAFSNVKVWTPGAA